MQTGVTLELSSHWCLTFVTAVQLQLVIHRPQPWGQVTTVQLDGVSEKR